MTQSPHYLQWNTPHLPPPPKKIPFPLIISRYPYLIHPPSTDPTHHPKWYPDPISHFATVHFPDRQTARPTDEIDDKSVYQHLLMLYCIIATWLLMTTCMSYTFCYSLLTQWMNSTSHRIIATHTHTHTQPFYCWSGICPGPPGSTGTRKVKPRRLNQSGFTGARDSEWQWHLLGYMQRLLASTSCKVSPGCTS